MSFREIKFKIFYDSDYDDIVSNFFELVLKEAKLYKLVFSYYDFSNLQLLARGLSSLFWSGGEARFIIFILVSNEDYDQIIQSKKDPFEKFKKTFPTIDQLRDMMKIKNFEALGKLLSADRIKIKFALSKKGIFHMNYGIIKDQYGNSIAFVNFLNETGSVLESNREQFNVFKSWDYSQVEYIKSYEQNFDKYWSGTDLEDTIIYDMPSELYNLLIDAYYSCSKQINENKIEGLQLRNYQIKAIDFWISNGYVGLIEMATGTGKTIVAINCVKKLKENLNGDICIVIATPTKLISQQWKKVWYENFKESPFIIDSEKSNTKDLLYNYTSFVKKSKVIIGTYEYISSDYFVNEIMPMLKGEKLLIADEVHWLGAHKYSFIMQQGYKYRLGLSATPQRMFDEQGTELLMKFFNNKVFSYTLSQAIAEGYLSEYQYYPYFCPLSEEEIDLYEKLTKKFLINLENEIINYILNNDEIPKSVENILFMRAKIVKKARCKIPLLQNILENLKKNGKLKFLIVYFEDYEQIGQAKNILNNLMVKYQIISVRSNSNERRQAIKLLSEGKIDCILAMKVLDEGLDIPFAEREIIISSSSNPRQYIQRAGRILRKSENKKIAEIYDIIIYADLEKISFELNQIEKNVISNEIKRAMYFCNSARNKYECIKLILNLGEKFNISIWNNK
ncbi:MAG: DEAD/DEAH box helicase family protein [Candidatus Nanopusillus acidilobi]